MILISHRGNISGPNKEMENKPEYIIDTLHKGYDVEIDVWSKDKQFYLGHDKPRYEVDRIFIQNPKLWCHAKNLEALKRMLDNKKIHCFWHETDKYTITSKGLIWTYPEERVTPSSVVVVAGSGLSQSYKKIHGICGDYVLAWSKKFK